MSTTDTKRRRPKKDKQKAKAEAEAEAEAEPEENPPYSENWTYLEEHCICTLCFDVLVDPVTLPCQHNVCIGCIPPLLEKNDEQRICPKCRAFIKKNYQAAPNLLLSEMISHYGGEFYHSMVQDRHSRLEQERQLGTYYKSDRFNNVYQIVRGFLKEQSSFDFQDLLNQYKEYQEIEIIIVLHRLLKNNEFSIHDQKIIGYQFFPEYLLRIYQNITPETTVSLLVSYFGIQENFIYHLLKKYPNNSPIYQRINKLSDEDLNSMVEFTKKLELEGELVEKTIQKVEIIEDDEGSYSYDYEEEYNEEDEYDEEEGYDEEESEEYDE